MKTNRWVVRRDVEAGVPYAQLNRLWIGYDDATSVAMKAHYANQMGLAGAMIWSIETDDFRGICGAAFPLLRSIRSQLDSRTRLIHASDPTLNQPEEPSISLPSNDLQTEGSSPAPSTTKSDDDNFTCTKEGTFRHPTDCTSFIQCVNGESGSFRKFVTKCQSELAFDSSTGNCNWINQVQDCKR